MAEITPDSFGRLGAQRRAQRRSGLWINAWRRFRKNKLAVVASLAVVALTLIAVFADVIAPYSYQKPHYGEEWLLPLENPKYLLGTDELGRDMLSRLIYGGRVSLMIGLAAQIVSVLVGVPLGVVAGARGGKVDYIISRAVDVFSSLPYMVVVLLMLALLGPGVDKILLAIGLSGWVRPCRLIRGQVLSIKESPYVRAAISMGASPRWIMLRHLLPNSMAPLIVDSALGVPEKMFAEAGLSFLGLGVRPPVPSWGMMLGVAQSYARGYYHMVLFPALLIAVAMLGFTLMGDGLRDALDPRMSE